MKVKLIKFKNFKCPDRAHYNDSGADVFTAEDIVLWPHTVEKIPTGVGIELPDGYDAVIHCKSGLSSQGVWAANAPIDSGYRGEIHAILYNTNAHKIFIKAGEKIGQLVIRPVIYAEFVDNLGEERGNTGFGASGK